MWAAGASERGSEEVGWGRGQTRSGGQEPDGVLGGGNGSGKTLNPEEKKFGGQEAQVPGRMPFKVGEVSSYRGRSPVSVWMPPRRFGTAMAPWVGWGRGSARAGRRSAHQKYLVVGTGPLVTVAGPSGLTRPGCEGWTEQAFREAAMPGACRRHSSEGFRCGQQPSGCLQRAGSSPSCGEAGLPAPSAGDTLGWGILCPAQRRVLI